jgi:predicted transposase YdaD
MAKKKNKPKQTLRKTISEGNLYDKIFKENAEDIFMPLVEKRLKVKIKRYTPLREKMQTTIEREMDLFYTVVTDTDDKFILHLEFQTDNDAEMVYRVGEHHGMAQRRTRLKIRHVVVYLGTEKPTMRTELEPEEVYTGFDLINIHALDTEQLLSSQLPHVILLAVLSNYKVEDKETIIRMIVLRLRIVCKNPTQLSKYIKQLIILSRLRKAEDLTIKISSEMPITYDIKQDYLYQQGTEQGIVIGTEQGIVIGTEQGIVLGHERMLAFVVKNLLKSTDFDDEKIATLTSAEVNFVQKMRLELLEDEVNTVKTGDSEPLELNDDLPTENTEGG